MNAPILTALLLAGIAVFVWGGVESFMYSQAAEPMNVEGPASRSCLISVCGLLAVCIAIFGLLS